MKNDDRAFSGQCLVACAFLFIGALFIGIVCADGYKPLREELKAARGEIAGLEAKVDRLYEFMIRQPAEKTDAPVLEHVDPPPLPVDCPPMRYYEGSPVVMDEWIIGLREGDLVRPLLTPSGAKNLSVPLLSLEKCYRYTGRNGWFRRNFSEPEIVMLVWDGM